MYNSENLKLWLKTQKTFGIFYVETCCKKEDHNVLWKIMNYYILEHIKNNYKTSLSVTIKKDYVKNKSKMDTNLKDASFDNIINTQYETNGEIIKSYFGVDQFTEYKYRLYLGENSYTAKKESFYAKPNNLELAWTLTVMNNKYDPIDLDTFEDNDGRYYHLLTYHAFINNL